MKAKDMSPESAWPKNQRYPSGNLLNGIPDHITMKSTHQQIISTNRTYALNNSL